MLHRSRCWSVVVWLFMAAVHPAVAQDTIRIAFVDPLSGPIAILGTRALKHFQFLADRINSMGGIDGKKLQIDAFDNEGSPERSLILLKQIIDSNIRYIKQGGSTPVAYALSDAVTKHNRRNPDKSVLFLGWGNTDPGLTNEKCTFWHFRFDAEINMRTKALTDYMASLPKIKKVYLLNPDYSSGIQVERIATEMLRAKRPDVEIVGSERIPLGKIQDFTPYVAKIQASGADSVITMNYGPDMILFAKAAKQGNLNATLYTFFGGYPGIPAAVGESGKGLIFLSEWHSNLGIPEFEQLSKDYEKRYGEDFFHWKIALTLNMLSKAMTEAKSVDPLKVAYALEGLRYETPVGEAWMRKEDHQIIEPLFISVLTDGQKFDIDHTGLGLKTLRKVTARDAEVATTCKMERPAH